MASSIFTHHLSSTTTTDLLLRRRRHPINVGSTSLRFSFCPLAAAKVIDGKSVAKEIKYELSLEVTRMRQAIGVIPGLAVILVGEHKESDIFARHIKDDCGYVGMNLFQSQFLSDSTENEVINHILQLNDDPSVHGILVALPLPSHMNNANVLDSLAPGKDVDDLGDVWLGLGMFQNCRAEGCLELLRRYGSPLGEKHAVVISNRRMYNPKTKTRTRHFTISENDLKNEEAAKQADIGQPSKVRGSWIKPGAIVVDAGINLLEDSSSCGYKLVGDVSHEEAIEIASVVTPVPGGLGPMIVPMLFKNTVKCAKRMHNFE